MNYKRFTSIVVASLLVSFANAEWRYGVGTGVGLTSYDGDLKSALGKLDVDYDRSDFEGGFGAAGFATDDTWVINLSGGSVEYESKDTLKGATVRSTNNFQRTAAALAVGYVAYSEGSITVTPFTGLNYTKHEWEFKSSLGKVDFDDNWTDAILGLLVDYKINDKWVWHNSAEYTFGDSEGCYSLKTGVTWDFAEHWSTGAYVAFDHDEFESNDFDYDVDNTSFILSLIYIW